VMFEIVVESWTFEVGHLFCVMFEIVVESWTFEVGHLFCVMFDVKLVVAWEKCL